MTDFVKIWSSYLQGLCFAAVLHIVKQFADL